MAQIHGKAGNVTWDAAVSRTTITKVQSWSCSADRDFEPITSMQDTWETSLPQYTDWTATVECLLETTGTQIDIDSASSPDGIGDKSAMLELYFQYDSSTPYYRMLYGSAICTGINPSADAQGNAMVTFTFQGVGQLAWYSSDAALKTY